MTPEEAIARATTLAPVWLLLGEERFVRDQVVSAIVREALGGGLADFNVDKFTAGESPIDSVLSAARTLPMMAKRRVVLVRSLERWDGAAEGSEAKSTALDRLAEYARMPVETTCLVLVGQKIHGQRKLASMAKKQGFVVDCNPLDERKLPGWIKERAQAKGHTIDREVAERISELAGSELAHLDDVVERLSLYVGPGAPIDDHSVSACVTRLRLADTWKLVDAATTRDLGQVLRLLTDVYDPRDRGLPLVGALAWSLRQLLKLESALATGASLDDAARSAGIFPTFRARQHAQRLKSFRPRELEKWLVVLQETDAALKSSRRPADAILEEMLVRLCRRAA